MKIKLTIEQELFAADIGYRRQRNAVARGLTPRHRTCSLWAAHIEGVCAEMAAHIGLDLEWTGRNYMAEKGMIHPPDLGENTEVRWAMSDERPMLTIDPNKDNLDRIYVLVSGYSPDYTIHGYIGGHRALEVGKSVTYPERTVYRVSPSMLTKPPALVAA